MFKLAPILVLVALFPWEALPSSEAEASREEEASKEAVSVWSLDVVGLEAVIHAQTRALGMERTNLVDQLKSNGQIAEADLKIQYHFLWLLLKLAGPSPSSEVHPFQRSYDLMSYFFQRMDAGDDQMSHFDHLSSAIDMNKVGWKRLFQNSILRSSRLEVIRFLMASELDKSRLQFIELLKEEPNWRYAHVTRAPCLTDLSRIPKNSPRD